MSSFTLGQWQVIPDRNLLSGPSGDVQITHKSMEILCLLADVDGEVMGRQQLMQIVWPDTVVNEESLTRVISDLRRALGDDRSNLRYIETIPKRGYRLLVPVEKDSQPQQTSPVAVAKGKPRGWWYLGAMLVAVLLVVSGVRYLNPSASEEVLPEVLPPELLPLTSSMGQDAFPAFCADGTRIAFSRRETESDYYQIFVKQPRQAREIQITDAPADHIYPAWSPDGAVVAFVRSNGNYREICVVPSLGGPVQVLQSVEGRIRGLDWSPDGETLAYGYAPLEAVFSIQIFDRASGQSWQLAPPQPETWGDLRPRFSPLGDRLAFIRNSVDGVVVGVTNLDDNSVASFAFGLDRISDLDWQADGQGLVASGLKNGRRGVWQLDLGAEKMTRIALPVETVSDLSVCARTGALAVRVVQSDLNLMRYSLEGDLRPGQPLVGEALFPSTESEFFPALDPAGLRVAFCSDRTGEKQIYLAEAGSDQARLLTSFSDMEVQSLQWAPDGSQMLFTAWDGDSFLAVLDPDSGQWDKLPIPASGIGPAFYSYDGQWIYYTWSHDNSIGLDKIRPDGTDLTHVPCNYSFQVMYQDPTDGAIYFLEHLNPGLKRLNPDGSAELVAEYPPAVRLLSAGSLDRTFFYVVYKNKSNTLISHELYTPGRDTLGTLPMRSHGPLVFYPDGSALIVTSSALTSSHLSLVPVIP